MKNKSSKSTLKNLKIYRAYFEEFYKPYDSICNSTNLKLYNVIKNYKQNDEQYREISEVKNRLEIAITLLKSYHVKNISLISKISDLTQLRKQCSYKFEDNQTVMFSDQDCLNIYNSKVNEIKILTIEMNAERVRLMEIKSV